MAIVGVKGLMSTLIAAWEEGRGGDWRKVSHRQIAVVAHPISGL